MPQTDALADRLFGGEQPESPVAEAPTETKPVSDDALATRLFGGAAEPKQEPIKSIDTPIPLGRSPKEQPSGDLATRLFGGSSPESELGEFRRSEPAQQLKVKDRPPEDPDAPWYEKLWHFANAPLVDDKLIKNWFGADVEHWTGWGRGLLDLAEGLTSPLSIGLAVGTFGSSSLIESGGMAALKAAGMTAEEIADVTKGSKVLSDALKMGMSPENAMSVAKSYSANLERGLMELSSAGLKPQSLMAKGIIQRTGSAMLRGALKIDPGLAENIAGWTQAAADAGFTIQNAYGAAITAPKVLDAIKEGDYEAAQRYAVDAVGAGIFAGLGGRSVHEHAGELMTDAEAALGLRVKPSEENLKLMRILEPVERNRVLAGEKEKAWEEQTRKDFKDVISSPESELRARFFRESGSFVDATKLRDDRLQKVYDNPARYDLRTASPSAAKGYLESLRNLVKERSPENLSKIDDAINAYYSGDITRAINLSEERLSHLHQFDPDNPDVSNKRQEDWDRFWSGKREEATQKLVQLEEAPDNILGGRGINTNLMVSWHDAIAEAAGREGEKFQSDSQWPENIQAAIEKQALKNKPKSYVDKLLAATDPSKLSDREIEYAKHAGGHFDDTLAVAQAKEVLSGHAENYVTRIFKDPENDSIRKFKVMSNSGDFAVNTSMARHRIFETTLEGILRGYELADHDMTSLAAFNGNTFANIASVREALNDIMNKGTRASDGTPMAAVEGAGHVIEGTDENGNPVNVGTIINPKSVRSIHIADDVIQGLKKDVLKEGTIRVGGPERRASVRPTDQEYQDYINRLRIPEARKALVDAKTPEEKQSAQQALNNLVEMAKQKSSEYKVYKPRPEFTQLDRLIKEGKIVKTGINKKTGEPTYAWNVSHYVTIDHPSFKEVRVPTGDTEGNPIFVKGSIRIHPEAAQYIKNRFETQEGLTKKIPGLKAALAVGREAKGWLLAFSPFHFIQEGLRAIMTGISPIGVERFNPDNPMHIIAAEKGVWEFKNYQGISAFEDGLVGHSKSIAKIPILREVQSWTQSMLFDRYIPGLKLRGFERMMAANEKLHPEWTKDKLAEESAMEINERFGGIPYKRIGRSAAAMDLARLTTLAPDWLESEMRFMKRTFGGQPEGAVARRDVMKMALGLWATSRVLNYLITGKPHNEAPFGVAYKDEDGREKVYSIRTLPTDLLHAASDPTGFLNGRVAPLLKSGIMTYTGRDEQGRKLSTNGIFVNLMRNVLPIGPVDVVRSATGIDTGLSPKDAALKWGGLTVAPYRTQAQKLASQLASDRNESGPLDPAKLRKAMAVSKMEDDIRAGQAGFRDLQSAIDSGTLHADEAKKIVDNVKKTQGMDADTARLYTKASRLPLEDVIKIFDAATNEEKMALSDLIIKKKMAYVKKATKDMTPDERSSDPTFQWIKKNFTNEVLPASGPSRLADDKSGSKILQIPVIKGVKIDDVDKAFEVFKGRPLTNEELKAVAPIFQNLLDLGQIKVHELPQQVINYISSPVIKIDGKDVHTATRTAGVAPGEGGTDIGIVKGKEGLGPNTFGSRGPQYAFRPEVAVVGHEITHLYQNRGGYFDPNKEGYDYGGTAGLIDARKNGQKFKDFGSEQQASIVGNYVELTKKISIEQNDFYKQAYANELKVLQPYIDDLRSSYSYKDQDKLEQAVDKAKDWVTLSPKQILQKIGIF